MNRVERRVSPVSWLSRFICRFAGVRRGAIPILASAVGIAILVHALYGLQSGPLLNQGKKNLVFTIRTIDDAMSKHGWFRPPLYALLLWGATRLGLAAERVNETLFLGTLALVALYARRAIAGVHPLWPVLLLAVAHFNYANLHQPVAETLFVLLLFVLVHGLLRYERWGDTVGLMLATLATAGLGFTRYMALFFPIPLVALNTFLLPPLSFLRRGLRTGACLVVILAPVCVWMWMAYKATGYWTGDDRLAPRRLPRSVRHWEQYQGFGSHVGLTAKTLVIDFLSPRYHAGLSIVTRPYALGPTEGVGLVLLGAAILVAFRGVRRPASLTEALKTARSPSFLVLEMVVAFYVATLVVWTLGNNDPINTRFLYPSYALLVLLAFHAYAAVKARLRSLSARLPFLALFALVCAVQIWRNFNAPSLPIR
jgi:hypothetical protein